jgi:arabinogalactan endo-1,4-beta-galactosidase
MLHYAGLNGAAAFFQEVASVDYDLIGVSYYPWWHGRNLSNLQAVLDNLGTENNKEVIVAETAYPFTLGFNDFTTNIIGLESQLFLPQFPATPQGQRNFLLEVREITRSTTRGKGMCYWSPEWVAFKGQTASDGSPWENITLFDFEGKALPAWEVFDTD